mmetsp:Transcript_13379/g.25405  ORF Transcript_13379/g.25405 Transcript_13379/m.25405 type:complete len:234 (+) Transcript_13379:206-907(+)
MRGERCADSKHESVSPGIFEPFQQFASFRGVWQKGDAFISVVRYIGILVILFLHATWNNIGDTNRFDSWTEPGAVIVGRFDGHGPRRTFSTSTVQRLTAGRALWILLHRILQTSQMKFVFTRLDLDGLSLGHFFQTNGTVIVPCRCNGFKEFGRDGTRQGGRCRIENLFIVHSIRVCVVPLRRHAVCRCRWSGNARKHSRWYWNRKSWRGSSSSSRETRRNGYTTYCRHSKSR